MVVKIQSLISSRKDGNDEEEDEEEGYEEEEEEDWEWDYGETWEEGNVDKEEEKEHDKEDKSGSEYIGRYELILCEVIDESGLQGRVFFGMLLAFDFCLF